MNPQLAELASLIEDEIAVGEELRSNLDAQKKAILAWDVANLLQHIEAREPWLRRLKQLEERRTLLAQQILAGRVAATLRQLTEQLPRDSQERDGLREQSERARTLFTRLQADERSLQALMENLLEHIRMALSPLVNPAAVIYGESGAADPSRPPSALVHSKA